MHFLTWPFGCRVLADFELFVMCDEISEIATSI